MARYERQLDSINGRKNASEPEGGRRERNSSGVVMVTTCSRAAVKDNKKSIKICQYVNDSFADKEIIHQEIRYFTWGI